MWGLRSISEMDSGGGYLTNRELCYDSRNDEVVVKIDLLLMSADFGLGGCSCQTRAMTNFVSRTRPAPAIGQHKGPSHASTHFAFAWNLPKRCR
jgi:hypothetical protein